jgi:hypothetical protein
MPSGEIPSTARNGLWWADAVLARVQLGDDDDGDLQIPLRQGGGFPQIHQHGHQVTHRGRHVREDRDLIAERAIAAGEVFINLCQVRRELAGGNAADAGHLKPR